MPLKFQCCPRLMAQWASCLLHKHEGLSSDPETHINPDRVVCICNPKNPYWNIGDGNKGTPRSLQTIKSGIYSSQQDHDSNKVKSEN